MSAKITRKNVDTFEGKTFSLFGYTYTIAVITPQEDWFWRVEAHTLDPDGTSRYVSLILPSHVLTN